MLNVKCCLAFHLFNLKRMENSIGETKDCCCCSKTVQVEPAPKRPLEIKKTVKSVPSMLLGLGVAFFPKCPMCWAAYMSMLGGIGLSNLPYMKWLFPVLVAFLGLHLYLVFRKAKTKGYGPFLISLFGALTILGARELFPNSQPVLLTGMALLVVGSLWNSFSAPSMALGHFFKLRPSI